MPGHADFTVRISLEGWLDPNRRYFYRFIYNGVASRTGECQTLPTAEADVDQIKFGVLTCQDFTNGYYGALSRLAEQDVDFVIHLGDFIYESVGDPQFQFLPFPDRVFELPGGSTVALGLEDFRAIYRQYRSDPLMQRLLERHTIISIWDDHESANDCYWDYERDTFGAPDHPFSKENPEGGDPAKLTQLKLDSMRAWSEYIPSSVVPNQGATHPFDFLQIYRKFTFGSLAELFMTDERTYRSPPPCGVEERYLTTGCFRQSLPFHSMLGRRQRQWLLDGMAASPTQWKVWGNEVFQGAFNIGKTRLTDLHFNVDAWDGYEFERSLIMHQLKESGVTNLVVLTGDMHTYMASRLKIDYRHRDNDNHENIVGVEFMTPGVTSSNLLELFTNATSRVSQAARRENIEIPVHKLERLVKETNPHIHFFNSELWGYSIVEFNREYCEYTAYSVDKADNSAEAEQSIIRKIRTPSGSPQFIDVM
ncbi:Alkaline phosphatase D (APaseD) [Durusdinium trenchii]|uniref:Alkaline phosphatase D (APaseD) n=1 Tax=Durusdinium trenchii TaxID=1381693 RepID=A0ABP0IF82_9DINO